MTGLPPHVSFPTHRIDGRDCPACGAEGLRAFYEVRGIPLRSDLLVPFPDAAADLPTADVRLALCETCGFITNAAFDEPKRTSSQAHEAPPAFSQTVDDFAQQRARQWIDRYGLRGKLIVEIGCGQGEFLELICEAAGARGIGFDPAVRRERSERADVLFVAGPFEAFAAELRADFIFCRHTLEHIAGVSQFLSAVREPLAETPVVFEVPDTARMLAEGAFWEVGYERTSYFTRESLVRSLQRAGFEVVRTALEADGQHLIAEAVPTGGQKRDMPTIAELRMTSQFVRVCADRMKRWTTFAADVKRAGRTAVVWDSGSKAVAFLTSLGITDAFACVVDLDPARHGSYLPGTRLKIESPAWLKTLRPSDVVIMNSTARNEIEYALSAMNLTPTIVTV